MDIVEVFNKNKRDHHWSKNEAKFKRWFSRQLKHLLLDIQEKATLEEMNNFMYRNCLGYLGIGRQSGLISGIRTIESKKKNVKQLNDHVFGVVEIGKRIHKAFEEANFDIDYMVNEWLYENLYLWMTIKVAKMEHKRENINQNVHTIEEKRQLKHYINVSDLIVE
jgi:hypothetical protein